MTNVADFLPKLDKVQSQLGLGALFAREGFAGTDRTLLHMFDDANMLDRMNDDVGVAATTFYNNMQAFSAQVSSRTFGADGLSQGMPFVWQALDPNVAPYSLTV